MVEYRCHRCHKIFTHKGVYNRHINRKKPCEPNNDYTINTIVNVCKYCDKEYKHKSHLIRHQKICKYKAISLMEESLTHNKYIEHKIEALEKTILNMKQGISITNNNNNNNNIINNTINIISFSKTDLSHISDKEYETIMKKCFMSIPALIEKIHYNPKYPENHNIFITNMNGNYAVKREKNKWIKCDKSHTIDDLLTKGTGILEERLDNWEEECYDYDPLAKKKFLIFSTNENNDKLNDIKKEINLLLYNNRIKI